MKHDYDISKQFQDDLVKAYNSVVNSCWFQEEAYKKAVKQPAPRYYISANQARQILAPMVKGDFSRVDTMQPNRRRMYYSLFDKVIELSEKRSFVGKSLSYIVQFAVSSPAPEFFCSHHTMDKVRDFLKNNHYDDDGRAQNVPSRVRSYERLKAKRRGMKNYREQLKKLISSPRS